MLPSPEASNLYSRHRYATEKSTHIETSILKAEVENAIKSIKGGKAAGSDNITVDIIKSLNEFGVDTITELCNDIYETGHIPKDLTSSIFIPLPKKPRAVDCTEYRTISLMSHITKILLKIIHERIKNKIDTEVGEEQFGFRKNKGTREAILSIRLVIDKYIEVQKSIYICFIDYSKAFDRVQHEKLIKCLQEIGIDGKDIRLIRNIYWEQTASIRCENSYSPYIEIRRGVRQGCILSPSLFNIYTENIFKNIEEMPGLKINGKIINNLRYADDTVLLAESEHELERLIDQVDKSSKEYGLDINIKKNNNNKNYDNQQSHRRTAAKHKHTWKLQQ